MNFTQFQPSANERGDGQVTVSVRCTHATSPARLHINLTKGWLKNHPIRFRRCDVEEGNGDDEGWVRIIFSPVGRFAVTVPSKAKSTTRIKVPVPACVPQGYILRALSCPMKLDNQQLCLKLPIDIWKMDISETEKT